MSTDHRNVAIARAHTKSLANEFASTYRIQFSNSHNLTRIMNSHLLESLRENRNCRVHRVANHQNTSLRAGSGASLGEIHSNSSISVEQIITSHTRLSGDSSRDDHNIRTVQNLQKIVLTIVSLHLARSINMGQIHSHTRSTNNIVQREARNQGIHGHQKRHGLADTTSGTQNRNLSTLHNHSTTIILH